MVEKFARCYPGVYTEREKPAVDKYIAFCREIEKRGPVDRSALVNGTLPKDTPGIGPVLEVTEELVRYNHDKYDPENRLWHDAEYARTLGYEGIPVCFTYGAYDDAFLTAIDASARDALLVSQLDHSVTAHRPIYIGDRLYMVTERKQIMDITPREGAPFHSFALRTEGSVFNQRGEKVTSVVYHAVENLASFADPKDKPEDWFFWIAPPWDRRADRKYTDEDWECIMGIWRAEEPRGEAPLYWEDVSVGDQPRPTLDGPVDDTPDPIPPFGMGLGGSRTIKAEILSDESRAKLVRNPYDGIYRLPRRSMMRPEYPAEAMQSFDPGKHAGETPAQLEDDPMSIPPERCIFINFLGREIAIRHINNYIGYHGEIRSIRWGIMPPEALKNYGYDVPVSPYATHFLDVLPDRAGSCLHHGLERDVMLVRSRVYNKYVENGEYLIDLAWWIEDLNGCVYEEGQATAALPSRNGA